MLVRSEDVANPVVLFVHGGPGTSQLTLNRHNTRGLDEFNRFMIRTVLPALPA